MKKENEYKVLKEKLEKEFNEFPMKFAFSNQQFEEGMKELGLTVNDTDKIVPISGGGFIRKSDVETFNEMNRRHREEEKKAIENDPTGEGYIKDMFEYELGNHEYGYTHDLDETLSALRLTIKDINNDERLKHGLELVLNEYKEREKEEDEEFEKE